MRPSPDTYCDSEILFQSDLYKMYVVTFDYWSQSPGPGGQGQERQHLGSQPRLGPRSPLSGLASRAGSLCSCRLSTNSLTLREFMDHLQRHKKQLHYVVSKLDTNKDRRVTSAEIKVAFKTLGIAISLDEAEKLVSRIDDDNSLDISFEEWRDYLMFHPRSVNYLTCNLFITFNNNYFSSNIDDIIEYWRKESYLSHLDHGEDVGTPGKPRNDVITVVWCNLCQGCMLNFCSL